MAEGILNTDAAKKSGPYWAEYMRLDPKYVASEQLGDVEYEWPLAEYLNDVPLAKLAFDPKHIYYQREKKDKTMGINVPGSYHGYGSKRNIHQTIKEAKEKGWDLNVERLEEIAKGLWEGDIPRDDFIWIQEISKKLNIPDKYSSDPKPTVEARNVGLHLHELVHRSMSKVPELKYNEELKKLNSDEMHGVISYMIGLQFPEMKDHEYEESKHFYDIDLTDKKTEQKYADLYKIANDVSQNVMNKKLEEGREKTDKSFFRKDAFSWLQKLREKIGFNEGGMADINYLTRRL